MPTTNVNPCSGSSISAPVAPPSSTTALAASGSCCTGLECIEKPRFFCGQLLTDLDLEASVNYVTAKNRLHNRYLVGAGVVCGLAVRCDPCDSTKIIVDSGYALDCLGNDIIVCASTSFDVQGYLDCTKKQKQTDCNGKPRIPDDCQNPDTDFCLVISYDEKPTKPVSALIRDNGCRTSRCEPSRTLEVFRLDLIDEKTAHSLNIQPSVWSRLMACVTAEYAKISSFLTELANIEKLSGTQQVNALNSVFARMKQAILDYSKSFATTHCTLLELLCEIDKQFHLANQGSPQPGGVAPPPSPGLKWTKDLFRLYIQLLIDCLCDAFLMPCAECCDPEYVLLACLKIQNGKVISICNTVRTQVITGVSVRYWLQPLFDAIGKLMEYLCCGIDLTKIVGEDLSFAAANTRNAQAKGVYNMARSYSTSLYDQAKTKFASTSASTTAEGPVSTVIYFKRPADEVLAELKSMGVTATVTRAATMNEAYSLGTLSQQRWSVQQGANVELVVAPDNSVAGIRALKG